MTMTELLEGFSYTVLVFLALMFAQSSLHKVQDYGRFLGVVANYRVMPERLSEWVARLVIGLEGGLVVMLVVPSTTAMAASSLGVMLIVYALAMAVNLVRGRIMIDCGCGGTPHQIGWTLVMRNLGLAALALFAAFLAGHPLGVASLAVAILSGISLWLLYNLAGKLFDNGRLMSQLRQN